MDGLPVADGAAHGAARRYPEDAAVGEDAAHFTFRAYDERRGLRVRWWGLWRYVHEAQVDPMPVDPVWAQLAIDVNTFARFVKLRVKVAKCADYLTTHPALLDWDARNDLMMGWAAEGQALFNALTLDLACTATELWGLVEHALRPDEETRGL